MVFTKFPEIYGAWSKMSEALMNGPSPLSQAERELILAYAAGVGGCQFVYVAHSEVAYARGIENGLIERLLKRYASIIAGLKDSSGDFKNTLAVIGAFPSLRVFPGSESFLLDGLRAGGAGCITATGNINVPAIKQVYLHWKMPAADSLQAEVSRRRKIVESFPVIPAIKAVLARRYGKPIWRQMRVPLISLDEKREDKLVRTLIEDGYSMSVET